MLDRTQKDQAVLTREAVADLGSNITDANKLAHDYNATALSLMIHDQQCSDPACVAAPQAIASQLQTLELLAGMLRRAATAADELRLLITPLAPGGKAN